MSSKCRKCGNETPKDRQGHEQVCPKCLPMDDRISKILDDICYEYGMALFNENNTKTMMHAKRHELIASKAADITKLIEEAVDEAEQKMADTCSNPETNSVLKTYCECREERVRADERKKILAVIKKLKDDALNMKGFHTHNNDLAQWTVRVCETILDRLDLCTKAVKGEGE
jgi:DNA-directed RNA polymerase subunit F